MKSIFRTFTWKLFWRTKVFLFSLSVFGMALLIFLLWMPNLEATQISRWGLAEQLKLFLAQLPETMQNELSYRRALQPLLAGEPGIGVYFLDHSGAVVANLTSQNPLPRERVAVEPLEEFIHSVAGRRRLPLYGDDPRSPKHQQIFSAARFDGFGLNGYLYVILPTFFNNHMFQIVTLRAGVVTLGCYFVVLFLFTSVLAYFVYNRLTQRFYNLTDTVRRFREGDRARRIAVASGGDEVEQLGSAFNEMADTIDAYIKELEHKDRIRRELVANISHDLRGPTTLILGATELAGRPERDGGASAADGRYLRVIEENAGALKRLLNELQELAAFETSEVATDPCPFPPNELIADLLVRFAPAIERNKLVLRSELHADGLMAYGDPVLVERVLANLLENAIRYTPEGRAITVAVRPAGEERLRFSVTDEGRGIAESEIPHIFERHFQSSDDPSKRGSSGLGLAIVKKIVDAHESVMEVRRLEPCGTEFAFALPRAGRP